MDVITLLILSYLTGSIPTSIIVSRVAINIDIREHGTGNAGGSNSFMIMGWKNGFIFSFCGGCSRFVFFPTIPFWTEKPNLLRSVAQHFRRVK